MEVSILSELILVEPTKKMETFAMAYRNNYILYGETHINGSCGFIHYSNYNEWLEKVISAHNKDTSFLNVPATTFFTVRKTDCKIVGSIQLRHELTENLRKRGGHIGYGICPTERKKGYGSEQLSLVLEKAKVLHIPRVMISCDKDNIASAKVAINNGGKLEWEGYDEEDGLIQIFWIDLT
jgi:predicted acetyltransferase